MQILIQKFSGGMCDSAFLKDSKVMLTLLVCGLHFEQRVFIIPDMPLHNHISLLPLPFFFSYSFVTYICIPKQYVFILENLSSKPKPRKVHCYPHQRKAPGEDKLTEFDSLCGFSWLTFTKVPSG